MSPAIQFFVKISKKTGRLILRVTDPLDNILNWITKRFERIRKWLDEVDRHILVLPDPGCS
jgi:hypothetical protein